MEYYEIIVICIAAALVVALGAFFLLRYIASKSRTLSEAALTDDFAPDTPIIMVEEVPLGELDESKLVEITDVALVARISGAVPGLMKAGNAANNALQSSGTLYRAVIPASAALGSSGATVAGQASFVAVSQASSLAANAAISVIGVAAMVVGQYYMVKINAELSRINDGLSKLTNFQNNEYKSKVFALAAQIKKIAVFQVEIAEHHALREGELRKLDALEQNCIELLGQAVLTIVGATQTDAPDFAAYERSVAEAQDWYLYSKALLEILGKIAELKYTLYLGAVSREHVSSLLPTYANEVQDAHKRLKAWHERQAELLGVEIAESRRKRKGFDKALHWLPGLFNGDKKFRAVSERTVNMIEAQSRGREVEEESAGEFFQKDVKVVAKDGKLYYQPLEAEEDT